MAGLTSFSEVPNIDIAPLFGADAAAKAAVAAELACAASDIGFMYVSGTGIDERVFAELLRSAKRFFADPLEAKMRTYIGNSTNHRGYVPEGEEVFAGMSADRKEAFDLCRDLPADDPDYLAGNPMLGPNQWPDIPGFKEAVSRYYQEVFDVGVALMRAFAVAIGQAEDFFDPYLTKPPSQLRLIHYPFDDSAEDRPGIGAHTDYECLTLLRGTAAGLEVLNGAGHWVDVPPVPGAYVVNIGDMLELMTNGRFVATTHRVRKVAQERYAFPLFFSVDYDAVVAPLPAFVDADTPARPALRAGEHLFAQTAQSFRYLRTRIADGSLVLPEGSVELSSFGRMAGRPA
ncbi:isopenicillin N synthase family dioxygenase [Nocardia spumae]|uniref:isopenicillin N synthase family dioxygenase n=1 Tax=Nocardia spumae TaxID=2887190 RepID=UPI001D13D8BF|nr:2-oxoglutarate and iron-dependent oxygenase domain-containing protein [Nocardia spumae]